MNKNGIIEVTKYNIKDFLLFIKFKYKTYIKKREMVMDIMINNNDSVGAISYPNIIWYME